GSWGDGVPARLLDGLGRDDAVACGRCAAVLARLAGSWPAGDPRRADLVQQLAERFGVLSPPGRSAAFDCAAALVDRNPAVRQLVRAGLENADAAVRLRAAVLALRPEVGAAELLVPLLKDASAEVRRAAVLAVGPSRALVA